MDAFMKRAVDIERQKIASRDALLQLEAKLLQICAPQTAFSSAPALASASAPDPASISAKAAGYVMAPPPPTSSLRGVEARALGLEAQILRVRAQARATLAEMRHIAKIHSNHCESSKLFVASVTDLT